MHWHTHNNTGLTHWKKAHLMFIFGTVSRWCKPADKMDGTHYRWRRQTAMLITNWRMTVLSSYCCNGSITCQPSWPHIFIQQRTYTSNLNFLQWLCIFCLMFLWFNDLDLQIASPVECEVGHIFLPNLNFCNFLFWGYNPVQDRQMDRSSSSSFILTPTVLTGKQKGSSE